MNAVELAQALWLLLAALGLALSVSYAGLPVLGQGAFVAVGGVGTALLGPGGAGLPLGVAVLLAVVAGGVLGQLVALAASRLDGASLGLATWALAWLVYRALLAFPEVFGGAQGLVRTAPAHLVAPLLGTDLVLTPVVHVVLSGLLCLTAIAVLIRLGRGPGGSDLLALRQGPEVAAGLGIPVAARRRAVLTATASVGALSGAGTVVLLGLVAPADVSPLLSLQLFVAVLIGGAATWWGPVVGVALLTALPLALDVFPVDTERLSGLLTAGLLIAVLLIRRALRQAPHPSPGRTAAITLPPVARESIWRPSLLNAENVCVRFGSVRALEDVGIVLRGGQVHALIGPNGSGKTTLLRVLAGDLVPGSGVVTVGGRPLVEQGGPAARVRVGVVRTPQRTSVLRTTAMRQVAIGRRGGSRPRYAVLRHLLATPNAARAERSSEHVVHAALDCTDLLAAAEVDATTLTVAEQRRVQIARAVATGAEVLLLDEPAAGMSATERAHFADVVRRLAGNGLAVLLVEHDMRLVSDVADRVTVLAEGHVIATGSPVEVQADPEVRRAYLGTALA